MIRTDNVNTVTKLITWIGECTQDEMLSAHKDHIGGTILVVDDEPEILRALVMRLTRAGHRCIEATDGIGAAEMAKAYNPDVVLLDIGMPNGDGHTTALSLASHVTTMRVPIIYLTARTGVDDRQKALAFHAFDYITKPYTPARVLDAVERALAAYR